VHFENQHLVIKLEGKGTKGKINTESFRHLVLIDMGLVKYYRRDGGMSFWIPKVPYMIFFLYKFNYKTIIVLYSQ
jgi:hypothetical protein